MPTSGCSPPLRLTTPTSARALLGLARVYERQNLLVPARDAYVQAQSRFAELRLDELDGSVGSYVTERLDPAPARSPDRRSLAAAPARPSGRAAGTSAGPLPAHPLAAAGVPPSPAAGRIFLVEDTQIRPINPTSGAYAWSAELAAEPRWVGYLADHVIAATKIDSSRSTSKPAPPAGPSKQVTSSPTRTRETPSPAPPPPSPPAANHPPSAPFTTSASSPTASIASEATSELLAIDGDSGLARLVLPARPGHPPRPLVGRHLPHHPPAQGAARRRRPRPRNRHHTALTSPSRPRSSPGHATPGRSTTTTSPSCTDARTVALFDLERGVDAWTYREPSSLPRSGPPRLLGDAGRLLVLRDGSELVRLDPATGKKLWSRVLGVEDLADSPQALALDADRVFCACGPAPTLTAYRLTDGEPVWKRHLSGPAERLDPGPLRPLPARLPRPHARPPTTRSSPCPCSSALATMAGSSSASCSAPPSPTSPSASHPAWPSSLRRTPAGPWALEP